MPGGHGSESTAHIRLLLQEARCFTELREIHEGKRLSQQLRAGDQVVGTELGGGSQSGCVGQVEDRFFRSWGAANQSGIPTVSRVTVVQ